MNKFSNYSRSSRTTSNGRNFGRSTNNSFRGRDRKPSRGGFSRSKKNEINHEMYIAKAVESAPVSVYETSSKYEDFKLEKLLNDNIASREYVHPTKIQHKAIPHILEGKDILGLASTGSGKTAAFLIPMINKLLKDNTQRCLVVVPTRELAAQVQKELNLFAKNTSVRSVLIIGGENIRLQSTFLKKNPQFVIGTPGRLKDQFNRGNLKLSTFNNVVLDEVDRMLDMGFIDDIKELISKLTDKKQSLFFSATMTRESEAIANKLLSEPVKVEIEKQSPLRSVDQDVVKVKSYSEKVEVLHNILIKEEVKKTIVFTSTKKESESLSNQLNERGFKTGSIHGDKSQNKRKRVIEMFSKDAITILVATDVAARGIDIPDITHVINYDEPQTYDDYIHRIGRTGRIGKKGTAITFVYNR